MVEQLSSQAISIWLSMPHFTTADPLTGSVCLEAGSVPATSLNLYLKGTDEITFWRRHLKKNRRYFKKEVISTQFARVKMNLKTFDERKTPSGRTSYPFKMQLPHDLPPSTFCKSFKAKSLQAKVRYYLVAEIVGGAKI
jgi:hypothetical protein